MNKEQINLKIQKLVNHYNNKNYLYVIRETRVLLRKLPNNPFLMNLIGSAFQKLNDLEKAKQIFEDIISIEPSNTAAYNNLGNIFKTIKDLKSAEMNYKKALKIDPNFSNALQNYANLKYELNDYDEAIKLYDKAILNNTKNYQTYYNLGLVYQSIGKFENARENLKKVLELNPKFTSADRILTRLKKYEKEDPHIKDMEKRLEEENLDDFNKSNILFSLGKAYEDTKDYKKSFESLEGANKLLKKITNYKFNRDLLLFENIRKIFEKIDLDKISKNTDFKKYIFIVGLPRSGTSLTEQILSSHSQVYGAGELPHLGDAIKKKIFKDNNFFSDTIDLIKDNVFKKDISTSYNENIKNFDSRENYLTDKNPLNFLWIGFIRLIFSEAKIVHVKRNIKDNFFSIYKNSFDGNINWSYDKDDLLDYCNNYLDLMKFWNDKIPGSIYEVNYENLTTDTKKEVGKILKFCDLSWEDQCLEFYNTERPIKTVSSVQARKPIYKSSVNSFQNYEEYLGEYFSKLKNI